jgi:hypothetical protein
MLLLFCRWLSHTGISHMIRDSTYDFAIVEVSHLLALAIFGGAVLLVDLRFLNLGFTSQPAPQVARELLPVTVGGVTVMLVTGIFLFLGGPVRYYRNPAFQLKIVLFVIALIVHFALQVGVIRQGSEQPGHPALLKAGAVSSLLLWLSIGLAGRAIGYV